MVASDSLAPRCSHTRPTQEPHTAGDTAAPPGANPGARGQKTASRPIGQRRHGLSDNNSQASANSGVQRPPPSPVVQQPISKPNSASRRPRREICRPRRFIQAVGATRSVELATCASDTFTSDNCLSDNSALDYSDSRSNNLADYPYHHGEPERRRYRERSWIMPNTTRPAKKASTVKGPAKMAPRKPFPPRRCRLCDCTTWYQSRSGLDKHSVWFHGCWYRPSSDTYVQIPPHLLEAARAKVWRGQQHRDTAPATAAGPSGSRRIVARQVTVEAEVHRPPSTASAARSRPPMDSPVSSADTVASTFHLSLEADVKLDELYRETNLHVIGLDRHSDIDEPTSPADAAAFDAAGAPTSSAGFLSATDDAWSFPTLSTPPRPVRSPSPLSVQAASSDVSMTHPYQVPTPPLPVQAPSSSPY